MTLVYSTNVSPPLYTYVMIFQQRKAPEDGKYSIYMSHLVLVQKLSSRLFRFKIMSEALELFSVSFSLVALLSLPVFKDTALHIYISISNKS